MSAESEYTDTEPEFDGTAWDNLPAPTTNPMVRETWLEFCAKATETVPCLIEGLWPEAALGFIASPPKKGKTWVALSLALALSQGDRYLDTFEITKPRKVLYIALEGHRAAIRARLSSLARGIGLDPDKEIPNLEIIYKPAGINIADPIWAQYLIESALEMGAELVIVDVLRAAARIKENDASEFAALRHNLSPILDAGISIALLHHFVKVSETSKERTPMERMSGSGAMGGAMDVAIFITGSDEGARKLKLEFDSRDIAVPDGLGVHLIGDGTGPNGGFTTRDKAWWVAGAAPDEDDLDHPASAIAAWIIQQAKDVTRADIIKAYGCSDSTLKRREPELPDHGIEVIKGKVGTPHIYRPNNLGHGGRSDDLGRDLGQGHDLGQTRIDSEIEGNPGHHRSQGSDLGQNETKPLQIPIGHHRSPLRGDDYAPTGLPSPEAQSWAYDEQLQKALDDDDEGDWK